MHPLYQHLDGINRLWREDVASALQVARGITWDECHKIYIAMDDEQMEQMTGYGYDMIPVTSTTEALETLMQWYDESCSLKFVQAVETNHDDPDAGFTSLIPQGYDEDEEDGWGIWQEEEDDDEDYED